MCVTNEVTSGRCWRIFSKFTIANVTHFFKFSIRLSVLVKILHTTLESIFRSSKLSAYIRSLRPMFPKKNLVLGLASRALCYRGSLTNDTVILPLISKYITFKNKLSLRKGRTDYTKSKVLNFTWKMKIGCLCNKIVLNDSDFTVE